MDAARDEPIVGVTVLFVHFYPSGGYCEAPLEEAERISIPAWHTVLQLRDQIVAETKHLWEGTHRCAVSHGHICANASSPSAYHNSRDPCR